VPWHKITAILDKILACVKTKKQASSTACKSMSKFIFSANMKRIFQPDKALFAGVMGLITAKKGTKYG
jgi:hypothetical protein